jgi:hypothetical protein
MISLVRSFEGGLSRGNTPLELLLSMETEKMIEKKGKE